MSIKLSIVIPVYNAETFILDTLKRVSNWIKTYDFGVEVIMVNDGSEDNTFNILENEINSLKCFKLVTYTENRGKGYAVKKGMLAAKGEFRIFTDADIPYGFDAIHRIIHYLDFKEFDVCIGNRKASQSSYDVKSGFLRKLSSKIFTHIISNYVVTGMGDTQCGIKGFRGNIAEHIFSKTEIKGFALDVEVLYLCYKYEYDIKKIPVKFEGNNISTINLMKSSVKMLKDVLSLPIRYHILKQYS